MTATATITALEGMERVYERLGMTTPLPSDDELRSWPQRQLKGELRKHCDLSIAILKRAEDEKRALSAEEKAELRRLDIDLERIEAAMRHESLDRRSRTVADLGVPFPRKAPASGSRWMDIKTGKEIRALLPSESFADVVETPPEFRGLSLGRWAQGFATGNWGEFEKRMLTAGVFTDGGAMVPAPLSNQVIDLARARSVVVNMGAQTVPMDAPTLDLLRITGDPTAQWMGGDEVRSSGIPESQGTFGRHQLQSQTVAILERLSVELAEDAIDFGQAFENAIGQALGLAIDKAVLYGTPGGLREGLRTWLAADATVSINEVTAATNGDQLTNSTAYGKLIDGTQKVLDGNFPGNPESLGIVWAPRTWAIFNKLQETNTNAPLQAPGVVAAMRKLTSTQVSITETQGSSNVASTVFLGDFSQILLGIRTAPRIELSRVAGDAFSRLHVLLRIYARVDWVVLQPKWLTRIIGLIP